HRKASDVGVMGIFARQGTLTTGDLDRATRTMDVGAPTASPAFGLPDGRGGVPIPGGRPEQRFVIGTEDWMDGTHKKPRTKGIKDGILDERPEGSKATRRPPKFTPGPVVVQGALPRSVIRKRILAHRARFRYCYEQGLQRKPGLQGRAVVNFTIAHTGRVTTAHVASTLGDAGVQQCISRSVQRLTFPSFPEGVVRVRYPFTFAPSSTH
ncbi:MAG: AgmX/PglI C-terminal domain-containing protein, partial [Myxococcota bacterium]